jgi:hypothetical protein
MECTSLLPLPAETFEYAEWKCCRAGLDYHVEVAQSLVIGVLPHDPRSGGVAPPTAQWRFSTTKFASPYMSSAQVAARFVGCARLTPQVV